MLYNKVMERNNEQIVAEHNNLTAQAEHSVDAKPEKNINSSKKPLTPYQKYKNSRNQNGKKYFEFYNDVKVYTHNIWDW
ncbi:MAG: hypothetical protein IJA72_03355 [Clostridia bacterium]|nr:hypothetical protein [Clostridia bacterium]